VREMSGSRDGHHEPEDIPAGPAAVAALLRALLTRPEERPREELGAWCVAYIRSFLHERFRARSFGFVGDFSEVVSAVADQETASLLRLEAGPDGRERAGVLARRLYRVPAEGVSPADFDETARLLVALEDRTLYYSLRSTLRLTAEQGLQREWKGSHPEESRFARSFRRFCRGIPEPAIVWDARGRRVVSASSRRSLPPMTREDLSAALAPVHLSPSPSDVADGLLPYLVPARHHGGYCYLMDLARVVCELRRTHFRALAAERDRGVPEIGGGIPRALLLDKARRSLRHLVEGLLSEAERGSGLGRARAEAAVVMVLKRYDPGNPEWAGLSGLEITAGCLRAEGCADRASAHFERARYLARLLQKRWEGSDGARRE
jgi:hypothetical protein